MQDNNCEELDQPDLVPVPTRLGQTQDILGVEEGCNVGSKFWDRERHATCRRGSLRYGVVECITLVLGSLACHGW